MEDARQLVHPGNSFAAAAVVRMSRAGRFERLGAGICQHRVTRPRLLESDKSDSFVSTASSRDSVAGRRGGRPVTWHWHWAGQRYLVGKWRGGGRGATQASAAWSGAARTNVLA